ncbi:MAG: SPOR domain-containing protein [Candidatus Marinimicrobia bacterium]|nr:SPOR domain-containing protein [Candidatus Neomarinimicrobiota bacterium]
MKKLLIFSILILSIFMVSCESEKVIPGEAGSPVYLVPEIETSSDTLGCTFSWSFMERPLQSNLSVLSFQPSSNGYNIYFIPDVPGDYRVKCEVLTPDQKLKKETVFLCKIKGEAVAQVTQANLPEETTDNSELSEAEPIYLEDDNPSQRISEPVKEMAEPVVKPKTESQTQPARVDEKEEGIYTIQISSFKSFAAAEKEMKELKEMGLDDVYIKRVNIPSKGGTWYRVRTNSFQDQAKAREMLNIIKTKYHRESAWIDKIN